MPKENIQRAIDRGTGAGADAAAIEQVVFEGYGPGGAAILVEALTDNRNRTSADVRLAFTKHNGSLGEPGSVAWIFEKRGVDHGRRRPLRRGRPDRRRSTPAPRTSARTATCCGCSASRPTSATVREALEAAGVEIESAEVTMEPKSTVEVGKGNDAKALLGLLDALEEHDDVNEVHANFDIPERSSSSSPQPEPPPEGIRGVCPESVPMQVVMGIDPGAANLGFGIVRVEGNRMVALDGGVVETPAELPIERRLERIHRCAGRADRLARAEGDGDRGHLLRQERALGDGRRPGQRGRDARRRRSAASPASPTRRRRSRWPSAAPAAPARNRCSGWSAPCSACPSRPTPDHAADALAVAICHGGGAGRRAAVEAATEARERVAG